MFWHPLCTCAGSQTDDALVQVSIFPNVDHDKAREEDFEVRCVECGSILKPFMTKRFTTDQGLNALRTVMF